MNDICAIISKMTGIPAEQLSDDEKTRLLKMEAELHKTDDPMAHIGIRMVMKTVTDANYVNSLGLNNLTLTL